MERDVGPGRHGPVARERRPIRATRRVKDPSVPRRSVKNYDRLTQGAGFVNAAGAVELARHFAAPLEQPHPSTDDWAKQLIWGNYALGGGQLRLDANAWQPGVTWGASRTPSGQLVQWGVSENDPS